MAGTYLDLDTVQANLHALANVPESPGHVYRMPMTSILRWFFSDLEGYQVVQEVAHDDSTPDFVVLKVSRKAGGSLYLYNYIVIESKGRGEPWRSTEDQLFLHIRGTNNETKNVYGIVQIELTVAFYKHENHVLSQMSSRLHLVHDVHDVGKWLEYIKQNPMPLI